MDAANFERIYDGLQQFHAFFATAFGRKQWRERSRNYLQALLVQAGERRNAENLSESVGVSARALQRFLTEARWDDDAVMVRLQEYLAPRLAHPEAVWVLDGSDFPKQGRKSAGVARQYCGRLGKVASCQAGMFLAYVSPLGRALVDKRRGCRRERRGYRSKTELALEMLARVMERDHLRAKWVAEDDAFGMSPSFREGLAGLGVWYVLDVPGGTTVWPLEPAWTSRGYQGSVRPHKPKLKDGQLRPCGGPGSRGSRQRDDAASSGVGASALVVSRRRQPANGAREGQFGSPEVSGGQPASGGVVWVCWNGEGVLCPGALRDCLEVHRLFGAAIPVPWGLSKFWRA